MASVLPASQRGTPANRPIRLGISMGFDRLRGGANLALSRESTTPFRHDPAACLQERPSLTLAPRRADYRSGVSDDIRLPMSTRIVLRDRTRADPREVLLAAVDDLIREGVWRLGTRRGRWLLRERCLVPVRTPADSPEPLTGADRLLRGAPCDAQGYYPVRETARWIARQGQLALSRTVRATLLDMVERGYLEGYTTELGARSNRLSQRGEAALRGMPPRPPRSHRNRPRPLAPVRFRFEPGFEPVTAGLVAAWLAGFAAGSREHVGQQHGIGHSAGHAGGHSTGHAGGHGAGHPGGH